MPHRQDYSNVASACQRAVHGNNNPLVTSTPSLAAAQLVTSDDYIEGPNSNDSPPKPQKEKTFFLKQQRSNSEAAAL